VANLAITLSHIRLVTYQKRSPKSILLAAWSIKLIKYDTRPVVLTSILERVHKYFRGLLGGFTLLNMRKNKSSLKWGHAPLAAKNQRGLNRFEEQDSKVCHSQMVKSPTTDKSRSIEMRTMALECVMLYRGEELFLQFVQSLPVALQILTSTDPPGIPPSHPPMPLARKLHHCLNSLFLCGS